MKSVAVVIAVMVTACSMVLAGGFDPVVYAIPHQLSLVQGQSTAELGRGGAGVAIQEDWSGNPASLPDTTKAAIQNQFYSFGSGLDMNLTALKLAYPTGRWCFVVNVGELTSNSANLATLGGMKFNVHESDLTVQMNYRVSDRFKVGAAVAPQMNVELAISSPGFKIDLHSKPSAGFRLGGIWDLSDGWSVGGFYDNYLERVSWGSGPYPWGTTSFRSEVGHYGIAKTTGKWTFAADRIKGRLVSGESAGSHLETWMLGSDYRSGNWTFRTGSFYGHPTAGAAFTSSRWTFNYAFADDVNSDELTPLLGGSSTHAITASCSW